MPMTKRTKKVQVKVETPAEDSVDILPVHLDGWKNASKADKSRIAAKWRRDREVEYLDKLSALLPFPVDVTSKLDKGSILRLTITYLQLKKDVATITSDSCQEVFSPVTHVIEQHKTDHTYSHINSKRDNGSISQMLRVNEPELMLHALGGFLLYINRKGRILYVSENVSTHLGFNQYDMIGKKVLSFIHHDDHKELTKQFSISMPSSVGLLNSDDTEDNEDEDPDSINPDTFVSQRPAFYLRMRYQIMKKGSKTKHTGYLLSQWSGRIRLAPSKTNPGHSSIVGMVTICRPLQSTSLLEIRLDGNMFMSRHTLDLKFTFCDPRILTLVGYEPSELVGKTVYHFHNPLDAQKIQSCHANLIARGQSVSKYYRFLGKTGEWVWMQTRATVIYNTTNQPQYVVCMNYVIGQDEGRRHLMMEQEELKDQDIPKGAIDVTSLSSPGPAHSSGYCSADEDHSYSSSKTQETYSPGVLSPGAQSSLETSSQPQTPPAVSSPVSQNVSNAITPSVLGEKMQGFNTEELNLFDMIGDMMPQSSLPTSSSLPPSGSCSLADSWFNSLSNEIEMMDVDENGGLSPGLDVGSDGEGILVNMMKSSDTSCSLQQTSDDKQNMDSSARQGMSSLMTPQSSSAVITQSNVMLSSATLAHSSGSLGGSKQRTASNTQLKNAMDKSQSIMVAMSLASGMDANQSKANITMAEFSSGMMGDSEGGVIENNNEFALKFAENMVDQQINATLANYLTDSDNLMEGGGLSVQDASLNGLNDNTFNLLDDDAIINNNSSLSQFLTSSNPVASSSSSSPSPIVTTSGQPSSSSYQSPTSATTSKQMQFATPQAPPPVSAHMPRHNSMSNLNPKSSVSISRTVSHPQLQKLNMQSSNKSQPQQQGQSAAAYPGCDDHRYTSKQLESPPHNHKSNNHRNGHRSNGSRHQNYGHHGLHNNHSMHGNGNGHGHQPRLLEKFLLTKEKLNPNKGSDAALAAQGISQLQLDDTGGRMDQNESLDGNQQLLKKLLTEEILPKDVHKAQQEVIMDRRQSAGSSPSCTSPTLINSFNLDTDDLSSSIQLLSDDTSDEMDKLWTPLSSDEAGLSELDEIRREEMRQNDLWLQHCINELL